MNSPLICKLESISPQKEYGNKPYRDLFVSYFDDEKQKPIFLRVRDWILSKDVEDMKGKTVKISFKESKSGLRTYLNLMEINLLSDLQKQDAVIKDLKNKGVI